MTTPAQPPNGGWQQNALPFDSSPEDHPASPLAPWENGGRRTTLGGDGHGFGTSFAQYDPSTSSWKTSSDSLTPGLTMSSVTFPLSGSMRSGRLSPRAPWVPHTHESACSYWPTPRALMARNLCRYRPHFRLDAPALEQKVAARGGKLGYLNPRWIEWLMGFPARWASKN